jgi:hypothetical protein
MENNKRCYYYKKYFFENCIFDNIVDCCIVLLMEHDKEREKHVLKTINKYKLCRNTIIQYNKGYKKCNKKLYEQTSIYDINDAYYTAFKYADSENYKNILILEDDAIFDNNIKNPKVIKDIELLYKNKEVNMFHLGPACSLFDPLSILVDTYNCKKILFTAVTHANIYNNKFREIYYKSYETGNRSVSVDQNHNMFVYGNIYTYNKPLAVQPIIETENLKSWGFGKIKIGYFFLYIVNKILGLDTKNKPVQSYKKLFKIFFLVNIIFYIVLILIIIKVLKIIFKN